MEYETNLDELSISSVEVDLEKDKQKIKSIVHDLTYRIEKDNLIALSAPQIGEKSRIFCVKFYRKNKEKTSEHIYTFVNPVVTGIKGFVIDRETDPSLPDRQFIIPRNNAINIMYQDIKGRPHEQKFSGKATAVIQQMIDHLDGVLLSDIGLEIDDRFDEATEEEKNELLKAYVDSLSSYIGSVETELEDDRELKEMNDAIKFIQSVRSGETKLGSPITVDTSETHGE